MSDGRKDDSGKLRWSLIPWVALSAVLEVLEWGANHYAEDNWRKVPDARERYFNACQRHVLAWWLGEQMDPQTGKHHLAHAACCILFLLTLEVEPKQDAPSPGVVEVRVVTERCRWVLTNPSTDARFQCANPHNHAGPHEYAEEAATRAAG